MLVFQHPAASHHDTGPGHPERIERLAAISSALKPLNLEPQLPSSLQWDDPQRLGNAIKRTHDPALLERLEQACRTGATYLDSRDCRISAGTFAAACAGAACALAAVESVVTGRSRIALSAMRPPGHHCEVNQAMGFCFVNNIAVAADWLIDHDHAKRIAIVDFDVHHGNGTQHIFEKRADVLYLSTHQHPATLYPGTGYEWETGPAGTTLNIPLDPGTGPIEALAAFDDCVIPALHRFAPDFILISAGFDADHRDPLGSLMWDTDTFAQITQRLVASAGTLTGGRLVSFLEGGYDVDALAQGLAAHLKVLMDPNAH